MKRIYILRHAKSSWDDPSLTDFDRPLNKRGLKAAPFMGKFMASNGLVPDLIVSSPAERARQTAQLTKEAGEFDCPLDFDRRIYEADVRELAQVVSETEDKYNAVLLVGHNPGMEGLVRYLTGEQQRMPTAALAVILLDIDAWPKLSEDCGTLDRLVRPKAEMKAQENGD